MEPVSFYHALSDGTRLRIINLIRQGPLCVCHIQEILGEPQVKVSKHLAILKAAGLVEARREANWMIYSLPEKRPALLSANLECLAGDKSPRLREDTRQLEKLLGAMPEGSPACTVKAPARGRGVLRA